MAKKFDDSNMFFGLRDKMTEEQENYLQALMDPNINLVIVNAKAGSGKTTLAVGAARILIAQKQYHELFYTFAPVEEESMGFTPGDVFEKEQKYHGPLIDALLEINEVPMQAIVNPLDLASMKKNMDKAWVKVASHTFLRGTNLKNKVVIIDEAQNFTVEQLRKVLTRCHDDCKIIMIGHTGQCDIDRNKSGFEEYIKHSKYYDRSAVVSLTKSFRGELAEWADSI